MLSWNHSNKVESFSYCEAKPTPSSLAKLNLVYMFNPIKKSSIGFTKVKFIQKLQIKVDNKVTEYSKSLLVTCIFKNQKIGSLIGLLITRRFISRVYSRDNFICVLQCNNLPKLHVIQIEIALAFYVRGLI